MIHCSLCDNCVLAGPVEDNVPYELHLTVAGPVCLSVFREVCKNMGVKPIVLDLQLPEMDVMTSQVVKGTYFQAWNSMRSQASLLETAGFKVIREKIETAPWNPLAREVKPGQYFEAHLAISTEGATPIPVYDKLHISKNAFKSGIYMGTYRKDHGTLEEFRAELALIRDKVELSYAVAKEIVEFCLYDSNKAHDNAWLGVNNGRVVPLPLYSR